MTARIVQLPWQVVGEPDDAFLERLDAYRKAKGWESGPLPILTPEKLLELGAQNSRRTA